MFYLNNSHDLVHSKFYTLLIHLMTKTKWLQNLGENKYNRTLSSNTKLVVCIIELYQPASSRYHRLIYISVNSKCPVNPNPNIGYIYFVSSTRTRSNYSRATNVNNIMCLHTSKCMCMLMTNIT